MDRISGKVGRIIYNNDENGFAIFVLDKEDGHSFVVKGTYFDIQEGDYIDVIGEWVCDKKYGDQIAMDHYELSMPKNLSSLKEYLSNGMFDGIGPGLAVRIVDTFKYDTINILEKEPERLTEIPGIGKKRALIISEKMNERLEDKRMMIFLCNCGIPAGLAEKIKKTYGEELYDVIQKNPYRMVDDINGVGFKTADNIALKNGIPSTSPYRVQSGISYVLKLQCQRGHVCYPQESLINEAVKELRVEKKLVQDILKQLIECKKMTTVAREDTTMVYHTTDYIKEQNAAEALCRLNIKHPYKKIKLNNTFLDETQMSAVKMAAENGLMVLTGGPGCGKTTTVKAIIEYFERCHELVALAAPTGRAAKRMEEATGRSAQTIHRLLSQMSFEEESGEKMDFDVFIIDEASMLDFPLLCRLLEAIPEGCRLILVGDKNQLPSVGAGNVLRDIIASGVCPVCELTKIYRQEEGSDIVVNAYHILHGEQLEFSNKDFFFRAVDNPEDIKSQLIHYATESLPNYVGVPEVQVLTPLHGRMLGTDSLNEALREKLNPEGEKYLGFRIGDKVIHTRNNYELIRKYPDGRTEIGVMNGDVGRVINRVQHYHEKDHLIIELEDGSIVDYAAGDCVDLQLAYALTVHKSQGSEYPAVIIPVYDYIYNLTTMNLLYTAVTRAKKCIMLIGKKEILVKMIYNTRVTKRYTGLEEELRFCMEHDLAKAQ